MKPNEIWGFYLQFGLFFPQAFFFFFQKKPVIPLKDSKHCPTLLVLKVAITKLGQS